MNFIITERGNFFYVKMLEESRYYGSMIGFFSPFGEKSIVRRFFTTAYTGVYNE